MPMLQVRLGPLAYVALLLLLEGPLLMQLLSRSAPPAGSAKWHAGKQLARTPKVVPSSSLALRVAGTPTAACCSPAIVGFSLVRSACRTRSSARSCELSLIAH